MYRHHQREIMKRTLYDWLRTMIHSFAQQIMKQNFMYYRIYVALWSDHAWRLVFYFYYIKYAVSDDRIYFRHVNQNIDQLLTTDRNQNMIQNKFSLNDEIAENCTIILFDMHGHTQKWWIRIKNKNFDANKHVIQIIDDMWAKNDARHFNTDWSDVVCRRKDVCENLISHSSDWLHLNQKSPQQLISENLDLFDSVNQCHTTLKMYEKSKLN